MNSTMKTSPYADSFAETETTQVTQSVLTDSVWVRLSPLLWLLTFMWLAVAFFLGWW